MHDLGMSSEFGKDTARVHASDASHSGSEGATDTATSSQYHSQTLGELQGIGSRFTRANDADDEFEASSDVYGSCMDQSLSSPFVAERGKYPLRKIGAEAMQSVHRAATHQVQVRSLTSPGKKEIDWPAPAGGVRPAAPPGGLKPEGRRRSKSMMATGAPQCHSSSMHATHANAAQHPPRNHRFVHRNITCSEHSGGSRADSAGADSAASSGGGVRSGQWVPRLRLQAVSSPGACADDRGQCDEAVGRRGLSDTGELTRSGEESGKLLTFHVLVVFYNMRAWLGKKPVLTELARSLQTWSISRTFRSQLITWCIAVPLSAVGLLHCNVATVNSTLHTGGYHCQVARWYPGICVRSISGWI